MQVKRPEVLGRPRLGGRDRHRQAGGRPLRRRRRDDRRPRGRARARDRPRRRGAQRRGHVGDQDAAARAPGGGCRCGSAIRGTWCSGCCWWRPWSPSCSCSSPAAPTAAPGRACPSNAAPKGTPHLIKPVQLCAHDYNPDALVGPKVQHPTEDGLAIDGNLSTAWTTESYDGDVLGKPGVGLYVSYNPAVAAGSMILHTSTPGYSVEIYATNESPIRTRSTRPPNGWHKLSDRPTVKSKQTIRLHTARRPLPLLPGLDHGAQRPRLGRDQRDLAVHRGLSSDPALRPPDLLAGRRLGRVARRRLPGVVLLRGRGRRRGRVLVELVVLLDDETSRSSRGGPDDDRHRRPLGALGPPAATASPPGRPSPLGHRPEADLRDQPGGPDRLLACDDASPVTIGTVAFAGAGRSRS